MNTTSPDATSPLTPVTGESAPAFAAFCWYLELGPQRRYFAVVRQFGVSLRTVKRWATTFDWRGRLQAHTSQSAAQFAAAHAATEEEEGRDAAQREQALRERQYAVAEALLLAAERYLERVGDDDLDQMNFAEACKALDVATRLGRQGTAREPAAGSSGTEDLRDQLAALLEQAYGEEVPNPDRASPSAASAAAAAAISMA